MKKFISVLFIFTLFGCERYELQSPPKLTGGKWIFTDYEITVISAISPVTIIKNDTICINSFNNQSFVSGGVLMKQIFQQTATDRRFVKGKTTWEFDSNNNELYCEYLQGPWSVKPEPFWVRMSIYNQTLQISNSTNGSTTNYTYRANDIGYPKNLTLVSPPIMSDLYLSNGTRDKAVTVRVTLYFSR